MVGRGPVSRLLAVAIVERALEVVAALGTPSDPRVRLDEALLTDPRVRAMIEEVSAPYDHERWQGVVTRLSIVLARECATVWTESYPDRRAPLEALEAAEAWAACPCERFAEAAAKKAPSAISSFEGVWNTPPKDAAWAGRTAAWVADAPKYHWQAVAAIHGACRAMSVELVIEAAERFLTIEIGRGALEDE